MFVKIPLLLLSIGWTQGSIGKIDLCSCTRKELLTNVDQTIIFFKCSFMDPIFRAKRWRLKIIIPACLINASFLYFGRYVLTKFQR